MDVNVSACVVGRQSWKSHQCLTSYVRTLKFYEQTGGFDLSYQVASDYDMVLRLTENFPISFHRANNYKMNAGGICEQKALMDFLNR